MKLYNVYEIRPGGTRHFLNSVFAESMDEAQDVAHDQFGAPIEVENAGAS